MYITLVISFNYEFLLLSIEIDMLSINQIECTKARRFDKINLFLTYLYPIPENLFENNNKSFIYKLHF